MIFVFELLDHVSKKGFIDYTKLTYFFFGVLLAVSDVFDVDLVIAAFESVSGSD